MKFYNVLLTLVAASSVLSFNAKGGLYLTDSTEKKHPIYENVSKECQEDLDKTGIFSNCMDNRVLSVETNEERCKKLSSQLCVKFYENPFAELPNCEKDPIFIQYTNTMKGIDPTKNLYCLYNEGKLCPTVNKELSKGSFGDEDVLETCKLKACTEGLINLFEVSVENAEASVKLGVLLKQIDEDKSEMYIRLNKETFGKYLDHLKSSNCTSQAKDDTATATYVVAEENSSANNIKITSILFTTIGLALAYLLL